MGEKLGRSQVLLRPLQGRSKKVKAGLAVGPYIEGEPEEQRKEIGY